jgi:hypothetical protein
MEPTSLIEATWRSGTIALLLLVICGTSVLATPAERMLPGYKKKIVDSQDNRSRQRIEWLHAGIVK